MKFLLEMVACCITCSFVDRKPAEEKVLLVAREPRRRVLRRRGRRRAREWRPSLSSISEDNVLMTERINKSNFEKPAVASWRKRKVSSSMSQRDQSRFSDLGHDVVRRAPLETLMSSFPPIPSMF